MAQPQLRLVTEPATTPFQAAQHSDDPVLQVFGHWAFMAQRNPARTKLGPGRRQAINAALMLYSVEDLQLAVEGNLVDDWCVQHERHDIEWLLQGEGRIERFIELGERLRARLQQRAAQRQVQDAPSVVDPQAAEAARERLRAFVGQVRARMGGAGMTVLAEPVVDVMERRLLAWAAWRTGGGNGSGYPTRSVLDPSWTPPAPGMRPSMRVYAASDAMERALNERINGLTLKLRDALYAVYIKRMAPADQAQALGCQPATVRARVVEAKRQLALRKE